MTEDKKGILVIDDSQSSRLLYKTILLAEGKYDVFLAGTVREGLKLFSSSAPGLVVLDMDLPDGTGVDFLKEIQLRGEKPGIIVISAIKKSDVIIESARLGIISYLIKPVDINIFVKKVREFFQEASL